MDCWREYPTARMILHARYLPNQSHRANETEQKLMQAASSNAKSFDTLPLAVQAALQQARLNG